MWMNLKGMARFVGTVGGWAPPARRPCQPVRARVFQFDDSGSVWPAEDVDMAWMIGGLAPAGRTTAHDCKCRRNLSWRKEHDARRSATSLPSRIVHVFLRERAIEHAAKLIRPIELARLCRPQPFQEMHGI